MAQRERQAHRQTTDDVNVGGIGPVRLTEQKQRCIDGIGSVFNLRGAAHQSRVPTVCGESFGHDPACLVKAVPGTQPLSPGRRL